MNIDIDKLRDFFKQDRFAMNAGIVIEAAGENFVECSMEIRDMHLNAGNGVQGGATFTLADFAFAVHANMELVCGGGGGMTVGQSNSISFLGRPKGKRLIARSTRLSKGRNISVYRIAVTDELGTPVAEMHGNGFTLKPAGGKA
ncbi:MAG: PaaI family thioesterase [Clostridiales Family XIII bacterium]|jgi:acyl-CoA thioesterase|nr:PaaI family thioesterase [Clostridiales Family XIII bacterium]